MFRNFLPREVSFFDFFEKHIALTIEGCRELVALTNDGDEIPAFAERIKAIEHKTDGITHECIEALHRTFITPMDRSDIHRLIRRLDDIIDFVDAAAIRIKLYDLKEIRHEAQKQAEILVQATVEIGEALKLLRNMNNAEKIKERCIAISTLENKCDVVLHEALVRLFREETDPILIIKWKEIFERLEKAADRCEDVANIIEGVMIEAS